MDDFSVRPDPTPDPAPRHPMSLSWIWNLLTLVFVLGAVGMAAVVWTIFSNPASSLNPFPPPTQVPTLFIPTRPPLPTPVIATAVVAQSLPTATLAQPTQPPLPTPTAIAATPVGTQVLAAATATPRTASLFSFALQADPLAIEASRFNPGRGCNWVGIAGQVFDLRNSPVALGIIVQVNGSLDGKAINITSLSGTATQYGPSGYEITLGNKPVNSKGQVWIRLLDQSGIPISDRVFIDTSADCSKNLILINFKQVK